MGRKIKAEIEANAHHTISKITGARKPELCPKCGSKEWYRQDTFTKTVKEYSDGHEREVDFSNDCMPTWRCDDCDYDTD